MSGIAIFGVNRKSGTFHIFKIENEWEKKGLGVTVGGLINLSQQQTCFI